MADDFSRRRLVMTGKQLKNSILQWAIQGKLVPQDPNDEPASVLLEKIRAEKARLIKEGKIKKDKNESIIYRGEDNSYYEKFADGKVVCIDEEIPFEIPSGWEWCRFSSIYWQLTDGTHSTPKYTQSGIPFLSVKDMSTGRLSFANTKFISEEEHKLLSQRCHPCKGDLLLSKVGTTGIPLIIDDDREFSIFVSLALIKFFPKFVDSSFLIALLNSPLVQMQVKENTRGVGNKNWVLTAISNTLLAIPPLREQQRIVEKIDILSPYTDRYAHSESKISHWNKEIGSNLKKSILHEAIQGKLVPQDASEEPASVLLQRIKEEKLRLVKEGKLKKKDVVDSVIFKGDDNKYYEQLEGTALQIETDYTFPETWEVVKLSHICRLMDGEKKEGNYVCLDAKYLRGKSSGDVLQKGKFVSTGDNIILVDGENSGEVFAVPHDGYMGSTFKQLWVSENMHLPYVLYFIQFYKDLLRNSKKGAAIPHLNKEIFYSLVVGIPPYQEQERIAMCIREIIDRIKGN